MAKLFCLLLAAGVGSRFGAEKPKQYIKLDNGKTILENSLANLSGALPDAQIVILLNKADDYFANLDLTSYKFDLCTGGDLRAYSLLNGLLHIKNQARAEDWVLVQDAARTLTHKNDIQKLLKKIEHSSVGGLLAQKITDTVKYSSTNSHSEKTLDRNNLWAAQTPQIFRFGILLQSLEQGLNKGIEITDEASCIELQGLKPLLVKSDFENFKVTRLEDLAMTNFILKTRG